MVKDNSAKKFSAKKIDSLSQSRYLPNIPDYTSISLSDIKENRYRLEANAFSIQALKAKTKLLNNRFGAIPLWSQHGLIKRAFHFPRFKRIFTDNSGIPIYQPASITHVYPKRPKYISEQTDTDIDALRVKKGMLLMTISGTIGKVGIVGRTIDGQVFSHDLLRIEGRNDYDTGYMYAYFHTEIGQHILQSNNYGAVIKHIEPDHLENVIIPNVPDKLKKPIHNLIISSYDLRDDSNDLIDRAEAILYSELKLPPIHDLEPTYLSNSIEVRSYSTKLSELKLRLDGSYHIPVYKMILTSIINESLNVLSLSNSSISDRILLPGRFKRTYVDSENHGIKFIGGKQIHDLNPASSKLLSRKIHNSRLGEELILKENTILITRSGTIGKVSLVPKHWGGWAANEHIIRLFPVSDNVAGYIYCWLHSDYGNSMIKKYTYGSVVDEIDATHVGNIPIPLLKNQSKQSEINDLVITANELRHQAHLKEQEAINKMEEILKMID